MTCYGPLVGYYSKFVNASGKRSITFNKRDSFSGVPITVACGECVGCRLSWRKEWAVRCVHEKRMYGASAFVTLTYDDAHLPLRSSLELDALQRFMKRLRKVRPVGLRFFAVGEYGDLSERPHYHLLLFNTEFVDRKFWKQSASGENLYKSEELRRLWKFGDNVVGDISARSCAYVAGYVMKKVGVVRDYFPREPEFRVMSRNPGLGTAWFEKYYVEAYRDDSAILDAREVGLPRFYDVKYRAIFPASPGFVDKSRLGVVKRERREFALSAPDELTKERMFVREKFEQLKLHRFTREL